MSLAARITAIYDQGDTRTAFAHAICQAVRILEFPKTDFEPCRLWVHFIETAAPSSRKLKKEILAIEGAGICSERQWPWDESEVRGRPPSHCAPHSYPQYSRYITICDLENPCAEELLYSMKYCLCAGWPIIASIEIFPSFIVCFDGTICVPAVEERVLGGHDILLIGYDDAKQSFTFCNSWAASWGAQGFGSLPYEYITDPGLTRQLLCVTPRPAQEDDIPRSSRCTIL